MRSCSAEQQHFDQGVSARLEIRECANWAYVRKEIELPLKAASYCFVRELLVYLTLGRESGDHVPVLPLLDYEVSEATAAFTLPLAACSLNALLRALEANGELLAREQTVQVMRELLKAVSTLHRHRILHRDLKLHNFLVGFDGKLYLCDFGNAMRLCASTPKIARFMPASISPPEVLLGGTRYETAADIWSLGIVFLQMLLGVDVFNRDSALNTLACIVALLGSRAILTSDSLLNKFPKFKRFLTTHKVDSFMENRLRKLLQPECYDVLAAMLCWRPAQRASAVVLLETPLLRAADVTDGTVFAKLKSLSVESKLISMRQNGVVEVKGRSDALGATLSCGKQLQQSRTRWKKHGYDVDFARYQQFLSALRTTRLTWAQFAQTRRTDRRLSRTVKAFKNKSAALITMFEARLAAELR